MLYNSKARMLCLLWLLAGNASSRTAWAWTTVPHSRKTIGFQPIRQAVDLSLTALQMVSQDDEEEDKFTSSPLLSPSSPSSLRRRAFLTWAAASSTAVVLVSTTTTSSLTNALPLPEPVANLEENLVELEGDLEADLEAFGKRIQDKLPQQFNPSKWPDSPSPLPTRVQSAQELTAPSPEDSVIIAVPPLPLAPTDFEKAIQESIRKRRIEPLTHG